jgi:hypothetical protein
MVQVFCKRAVRDMRVCTLTFSCKVIFDDHPDPGRSKTPNSKHQAPEKIQTASFKRPTTGTVKCLAGPKSRFEDENEDEEDYQKSRQKHPRLTILTLS